MPGTYILQTLDIFAPKTRIDLIRRNTFVCLRGFFDVKIFNFAISLVIYVLRIVSGVTAVSKMHLQLQPGEFTASAVNDTILWERGDLYLGSGGENKY